MSRTLKHACVLVAASLVAAGLSSCSGSSSGSSSSGSSSGSKNLNVAYWNYGPSAETNNKKLADGFMAKNPAVKVKLTPVAGENWGAYYAHVATAIAAGDRPDLMLISGEGAQFVAKNGLILPINDYLRTDPEAKALQEGIAPGLINGFKVKDEIVTLPTSWQNMVVYYNTKMFKAAGVPPPTSDWTWEDFRKTAKALTKDTNGDGRPDQYGFTWASNEIYPGIMPWVANAGGNLTADDVCTPTVDTPQVNKAVSFLNGMIKDKIAPAPMPMGDIFTRFQAGSIAMFGAGRWPITSFVPAGFTAFDIQLFPKGDTYKTVFGGNGYPILKSSTNPDLAWKFQKYTVSSEVQDQMVGTASAPSDAVPVLRTAATQIAKSGVPPKSSDLFYGSIDDHDTLAPYPAPVKYSVYESTVLRYLQLIFAGEMTPEDGLGKMQGELQSALTCE